MVIKQGLASTQDDRPCEKILEDIWDDAQGATEALIRSVMDGSLAKDDLVGIAAVLCRVVRFLDKIQIAGDDPVEACWVWTGARDGAGYGRFSERKIAGLSANGGHVLRPAHRFSYELFNGKVDAKLHMDHLCRNRSCVNPRHLEPVTPSENSLRGNPGHCMVRAVTSLCSRGHRFDGVRFVNGRFRQKTCSQCMKIYIQRYRGKKA